MKSIFFFLLAMLIISPVTGQRRSTANPNRHYSEALTAFKQNRFEEAYTQFNTLISSGTQANVLPYARFYAALSAFNLERFAEAQNLLSKLLAESPRWNQKNEVNYLMGLTFFNQRKYHEGLQSLENIREKSFQQDIDNAKHHFLDSLSNAALLKELQLSFPSDKALAELAENKIDSSSVALGDSGLAQTPEGAFQLDTIKEDEIPDHDSLRTLANSHSFTKLKNVKGQEFSIALLLPFRVDNVDSLGRLVPSQYVLDYYQGILLGLKQLETEGTKINLNLFDVASDEEQVRAIIKDRDFKASSIVFGPLYSNTAQIVAESGIKEGQLLFNPLSTDGILMANNPNVVLAHPSAELQALKAFEASKLINDTLNIALYFGNAPKDSLMASLYEQEITKAGGLILEKAKIGSHEREIADDSLGFVDSTLIKQIVVFASNAPAGRAMYNVLGNRIDPRIPMLATATAFGGIAEALIVGKRDLYILDTDFLDVRRPALKRFQSRYFQATNTLPSVYSCLGHDHILFLGRMLKEYGDELPAKLPTKVFSDADFILPGYDYTQSRDNSLFFVLHEFKGRWIPLKLTQISD